MHIRRFSLGWRKQPTCGTLSSGYVSFCDRRAQNETQIKAIVLFGSGESLFEKNVSDSHICATAREYFRYHSRSTAIDRIYQTMAGNLLSSSISRCLW